MENHNEHIPKMRFGEIFTHLFSLLVVFSYLGMGYLEAIFLYKFDQTFKWYNGLYMLIVVTAYIGVYLPNKIVAAILKRFNLFPKEKIITNSKNTENKL